MKAGRAMPPTAQPLDAPGGDRILGGTLPVLPDKAQQGGKAGG